MYCFLVKKEDTVGANLEGGNESYIKKYYRRKADGKRDEKKVLFHIPASTLEKGKGGP